MKIFIILLLSLLTGCTTVSKVAYLAKASDGSNFTEADVKNIGKELESVQNKQPAGSPNSYFLNRSQKYWDILTIGESDGRLSLTVQRISKYLRGFSDQWKIDFKTGSKRIVENVTEREIEISEVINPAPLQ